MPVPPFPGLKDPPIPGVEIQLGNYRFFVPPMKMLDLKSCVREGLLAKLDALTDVGQGADAIADRFEDGVNAALTILERSLRRNYPAITRETIEEYLDVGNCPTIMHAVLQANTLARSDRPTWAGTEPAPPLPAVSPQATGPSS